MKYENIYLLDPYLLYSHNRPFSQFHVFTKVSDNPLSLIGAADMSRDIEHLLEHPKSVSRNTLNKRGFFIPTQQHLFSKECMAWRSSPLIQVGILMGFIL